MRQRIQILLGLAWMCAFLLAPKAIAQPARQPSGSWQDVVLITKDRPLKLRLHIQIDGQPFRKSWEHHQRTLFNFLDINRDGKLAGKELSHVPNPAQLLQQLRGEGIEPGPPPDFSRIFGTRAKKVVTFEQFKAYYQHMGVGPIFLDFGKSPFQTNRLDKKLFELLDKNRNNKLSKKELVDGAVILRKLDADDNENISIREILGGFGAARVTFEPVYGPRQDARILFLPRHAKDLPNSVVDFVLKGFDRNNDGKLSQKELRVPQKIFKQFSNKAGSFWSKKELADWLAGSIDMEFQVALGKSTKSTDSNNPKVGLNQSGLSVYRGRAPALLFDVGKEQFKLFAGKVQRPVNARARSRLLASFCAQDNGDGFLDTKEIYKPPFNWTALFRLADRNDDDRLSRQEVQDYEDFMQRGTLSYVLLTVADRAPSLFEMIDADHDGQLGLRDVQSMWQTLKRWDNGDGVTTKEIPRQVHVIVGFGQPTSKSRLTLAPGYGPAQRSLQLHGAPVWFSSMDTNKDGDISPREFLGSRATFLRLDTDRDGLIDRTEAGKFQSKR